MTGEKRKPEVEVEDAGDSKRARRLLIHDVSTRLILARLEFKHICRFRLASQSFLDVLTSLEFLLEYWKVGNTPGLLGLFQTSLSIRRSGLLRPQFTPLDPGNVIPALHHDLRLDSIPPGMISVCDCRLGWLLLFYRHQPTADAPSTSALSNAPSTSAMSNAPSTSAMSNAPNTFAFLVYNPLWPGSSIQLPPLARGPTEHMKAYGILPEEGVLGTFRVFAVVRSGPMLLHLRVFCSGGDSWSPSRSFEIPSPDQHNIDRPPVLYGGLLYILMPSGDVLRVDLPDSRLSAFPPPNVHAFGDEYVWDATSNDRTLAHTGEHLCYTAVYDLRLFLWTAAHLDGDAPIWSEPATVDLRPHVHPTIVQFFDAGAGPPSSNRSCILAFAERARMLILKLGTEVYFYHLRTSVLERSPAQPLVAQSPGVAYETGILFRIA